MLDVLQLREIARLMRAAQDETRQIEPFTSRIEGFDLPSAYAVAALNHEALIAEGHLPVGRKIGFTNPKMWSIYGVREPIWAYVYDTTVTRLATDRATCSIGRFAEPKIEPEIVLHLRSAPPAGADLRAVLESVDWVAHAFEIVQSHFPGWRFQAADTVADSSLHGTLLVGEPRAVERLAPDPLGALESFRLALACNGEMRESGRGANVLGSPLAALAHLVALLSRQLDFQPLQVDEIVTTGTITAARSVRIGELWHTELTGIALPGLTVEFVP